MEKETTPKKRIRRTKKDIEQRLFDAALAVIERIGFSNLTIKALTKEAKVEPPVFYNRYKDLNDFLDIFVRKYDYWLNDSIKFNFKEEPSTNISTVIENLADSLLNNTCVQRLLAWELNEDNHITRRTSKSRDMNSLRLTEFFNDAFKNSDIDFNHAISIIMGGIYYLILHRERSSFNFTDYSKPENLDAMKETVKKILVKIFDDYK